MIRTLRPSFRPSRRTAPSSCWRSDGGQPRTRRRPDSLDHRNSPIDYHNCVVHADLTREEADGEIEASLERMQAHGVPGSWHVGPSMRPSDLGERLIAHGFEYGGDDIGMAVDLSTLPEEVPVPENFVVERVRDEAGLAAWIEALDLASGRDPSRPSGPGRCTAGWVWAMKDRGATIWGYWPVILWRRPHPSSAPESRGSTSCAPSNMPDGGGSERESH